MQPFAEKSHFVTLIEEQAVIPDELQPLPPTSEHSAKPHLDDINALTELTERLEDVKDYVVGHEEETGLIDQIIEFALMLRTKVPMTSTEEQFSSSRLLRVALVTIPVALLRRVRRDPLSIVVAAHFYAAALAVQPLFPAMGAMASFPVTSHFASLTNCSSLVTSHLHHLLNSADIWKIRGMTPLRRRSTIGILLLRICSIQSKRLGAFEYDWVGRLLQNL